ncbi:hypothetical protein MBOT_14880 [Mycobacterium botniense]|uniref:DUF7847 domain-containing protein n=1 Tax=Mycobacterium botniense TaxID=84962 RepID=A0A7I9XWG0_9MYCO|nr:hypothetical protein MBOT_14880 [Mycobacterium botniense]
MSTLPHGAPGYPAPGDPPLDYDSAGAVPPGYPAWGYSPPGYGAPGYPPPGYAPTGYGTPPGYGFPGYGPWPGYPPPAHGPLAGYGPPTGYGAPAGYAAQLQPPPAVVKPGIIPLRPLSLSDIFNGAVSYIRANPKPTLGLTAIVVVLMQLIALIAETGPLAAVRQMRADPSYEPTWGDIGAWSMSTSASAFVSWLAGILLSGMLTVIVGRAVFGTSITAGETWSRIRARLLPLMGLAALEAAGMVALVGPVVLIVAAVAALGNGVAAVVVGFPLVLGLIVTIGYLYTVLLFAPVLIVLERLTVFDAITRSIGLVRNSFWRVLGIRLLAAVVVFVASSAIAMPFSIGGQLLMTAASSTGPLLIGTALTHLGSAIGQIVTAPFGAGVIVLLYTDRRIRAEAFDLVLQTGAAGATAPAAATDSLWLTRPV